MSHSVNNNELHLQLYRLKQEMLASRLHSNLAQPIVAAKSFAAAIQSIEGDDKGVQEARELAGIILETVDQAYTVAYDLMREAEQARDTNVSFSMPTAIQQYGEFLRLQKRGITLSVVERLGLTTVDCFVENILFDCIKSLLVYVARQTDATVIDLDLFNSHAGRKVKMTLNIEIDIEQFNKEAAVVGLRKQLDVLAGTIELGCSDGQSHLSMHFSDMCNALEVTK